MINKLWSSISGRTFDDKAYVRDLIAHHENQIGMINLELRDLLKENGLRHTAHENKLVECFIMIDALRRYVNDE